MRPIPVTLADAQSTLKPHMPKLIQALTCAFDLWTAPDGYAPFHAAHDDSARAKIINDQFYYHANTSFAHDDGVEFNTRRLQRYLIIDDNLNIRFKQLTKNLGSTNYPTQQASAWTSQAFLPDMHMHARLTFGYRLDPFALEIQGAFVVLPNGNPYTINDWVWQVLGSPMENSTFGIQMPLYPADSGSSHVYAYDDYSHAI